VTWLLTRGRAPFLGALFALTAFFALHAARVGVETNNESLNTQDPAQAARYERFKATFGSDEDLLLAVSHPRLLEPEGLALVEELTTRIARIDGVRRVFSLSNAQQIVAGEDGAEMAPVVAPPFDDPALARRVASAIDRSPGLTGLFVSADRRVAGLLIEIEDRPGDERYRAAIIDALRAIIAEPRAPGVSLHLTGIAVQKHDVSAYIGRDQRLLMPLAVVVLAAVLAVFFRSALGVLLPLGVMGVTSAWTLGFYQLAGFELNAITGLLPPVLMVLSLAVSIHLIQGWTRRRRPRTASGASAASCAGSPSRASSARSRRRSASPRSPSAACRRCASSGSSQRSASCSRSGWA
jgi:predicted RND superfamily exporter protein